jgi:hypothetical protein
MHFFISWLILSVDKISGLEVATKKFPRWIPGDYSHPLYDSHQGLMACILKCFYSILIMQNYFTNIEGNV